MDTILNYMFLFFLNRTMTIGPTGSMTSAFRNIAGVRRLIKVYYLLSLQAYQINWYFFNLENSLGFL